MRVFLDTNVLASAVATRGICADVLQAALAEHEVIISEQVLAELHRALEEKFRLSAELAQETDAFMRRQAHVVGHEVPKLNVRVRDQDDVGIVEQAVAGAADVLISGDRDLTDMVGDRSFRILTPRGFWDLLRARSAEQG